MNDLDGLVGRLAPISDADAARLIGPDADREILRQVTAASPEASRPRPLRRLVLGLPLVVGTAAAAVAIATITHDGEPAARPPKTAPVQVPNIKQAAALTFTKKGGYIDVRVRDPLADPQRYNREFAERGLKIRLNLVPSSPSIVGTVVFMDQNGPDKRELTILKSRHECLTGGGGLARCDVGVRIPADYRNDAGITFGRAARPGEQYASSAQVTGPGEAMHGMVYRGRRVSDVLAMLGKRHVTVPEYRYDKNHSSDALRPDQVPGTWYVYDAAAWAKDQVLLFVGPAPRAPA